VFESLSGEEVNLDENHEIELRHCIGLWG
jgi:hypothetical protein